MDTVHVNHNDNINGDSSIPITNDFSNHSSPPDPLPPGWVLRHSRVHPGYVYYYHQETGESRWETPITPTRGLEEDLAAVVAAAVASTASKESSTTQQQQHPYQTTTTTSSTTPSTSQLNINLDDPNNNTNDDDHANSKRKPSSSSETPSLTRSARKRTRTGEDKEVRVLHILKKHRDSRRPSSWRNPSISITKGKAEEELKELITILDEVSNDAKELRATFEELARTESDCSSAKRGGDLGYFGRRKMQPAFEKASFGLKVGELSDIVETSSGVHVILRLG